MRRETRAEAFAIGLGKVRRRRGGKFVHAGRIEPTCFQVSDAREGVGKFVNGVGSLGDFAEYGDAEARGFGGAGGDGRCVERRA